MDETDRKLLDIIQSNFPLESHPYAVLGSQLGISEKEAFDRVQFMLSQGIIRRLGANFQSSSLGHVSSLCAAHVPPEKLESFIALVNSCPGVTHNYERAHHYNIWFTVITPTVSARQELLESISSKTGVPILDLPATKLFKIRVDFPMSSEAYGDDSSTRA